MAQAMIAYLDAGKPTRFLAKIAEHWKDTKIKSVTAEAIRLSAAKIYPGKNPATWNRQVIVPTQAVINYAAELGWCGHLRVKRFPVDPKVKKPVNIEWVAAFASQAEADGLPHLAALVLFMFGTGARIGQACAMTWADFDLTARKAKIYTAKPTPWTREAHLPPVVVAALANIPSNRKADELVFDYAGRGSIYDTWANIVKRAKIAPLTPHSCRHGFATEMLRKSFDLKTIAARGGWRDAGVLLKTYAHALDDETVTDALFGTNSAQVSGGETLTYDDERKNSA